MTSLASDFTVNLEGKVAFVTGGGRGIGKASALALAAAGADVVLCSRTIAECQQVAREIEALGQRALPLSIDLGDSREAERFLKLGVEQFGRIDILLNNAAVMLRRDTIQTTSDDWRRVLGVNLVAPALLASLAAPGLQDSRGCVINVGSIVGLRAMGAKAAYAASKAALMHLTRVMAVEWGPLGIRVNAIAPGRIMTPMQYGRPGNPEAILDRVPLRRLGVPEDIVGPILFLASEAASYITGQTIVVDGGWAIFLA